MDIDTCSICHFTYARDHPGDIGKHRRNHEAFLHGIKANVLKTDEQVFSLGDFRILVVSPKSSRQQQERAAKVALRAKRDTEFDFAAYHAGDKLDDESPLVFIGVVGKYAVAMLVLRKADRSAKVTWAQWEGSDREKIPLLPDTRWTIAMIWTLESQRRKGRARQLILTASEHVGKPISELAWSTPFTVHGYPLARSVSPAEVILTA